MLLVLAARLLVGLGDVDRDEPARLERIGLVALGRARVAEHLERPLEHVEVEVRDAHVRVAVAGDELHRLDRPGAGDPDLGVGLLHRPGPRVHVPDPVVLAHPLERAGRRPGLHDEVVRLLEALAGVRRVDRERVVLGAAADDHPGDEAPAADAVDHGELLGDPGRRVVEGQRVADHGDLHPGALAGDDRRHQVRRRHRARTRSGGARSRTRRRSRAPRRRAARRGSGCRARRRCTGSNNWFGHVTHAGPS